MKAADRRKQIIEYIAAAKSAVSAGALSEKFGVSRQVIVQDIAKQLVSSYPQEKLQLLDTAYITIYVTETIYLALTFAFAAFSIVALVRKKEGDDVLSLIAAAVMTVLSAARLIIGLAMCMNSTKEFMITAGGAPWLALVTTLAATIILAVFVRGRKKEESNKEANK